MPPPDDLLRHIAACNNTVLPGSRLPVRLAGAPIGWIDAETHARLTALIDPGSDAAAIDIAGQAELDRLARALAERGEIRWRDEKFDVRAEPDGKVLATLDRGALPLLGVRGVGVHLNGLVASPDGPRLWIGERAADKLLDPGKLDHLAAGGVPAGYDPDDALAKEAGEECGLAPALIGRARRVADLHYVMARPEGLRRDTLRCYDLWLPPDFVPHPVDGEVARFMLWPIEEAIAVMRTTDRFKFNVTLVLIDLGLRLGMFAPDEAAALRAALYVPPR